jgi:hypothetical protein
MKIGTVPFDSDLGGIIQTGGNKVKIYNSAVICQGCEPFTLKQAGGQGNSISKKLKTYRRFHDYIPKRGDPADNSALL